jgi:hypothetical protein
MEAFVLQPIKSVPDDILDILNTMMNSDCQPGKFSLIEIRDTYSKNTDILYLIENGAPVYFLLMDVFPTHKSVYIHDVCAGTRSRGKGIFKRSLAYLKDHYANLGFLYLTLDASDSVQEAGLDQKARIRIFSGAGFHINTETGYFNTSGDWITMNTTVLLDDGTTVEIQGRTTDGYVVPGLDPEQKRIVGINQIEKCFNAESNPISCPMIMHLPKVGGSRKRQTLKRRKSKYIHIN